MTTSEFRGNAKALMGTLSGTEVEVPVKEFSTGSEGWYFSGKLSLPVGDQQVRCQVQISIQVVGSKDWSE